MSRSTADVCQLSLCLWLTETSGAVAFPCSWQEAFQRKWKQGHTQRLYGNKGRNAQGTGNLWLGEQRGPQVQWERTYDPLGVTAPLGLLLSLSTNNDTYRFLAGDSNWLLIVNRTDANKILWNKCSCREKETKENIQSIYHIPCLANEYQGDRCYRWCSEKTPGLEAGEAVLCFPLFVFVGGRW